jgi:hypothetical protein
VIDGVRERINDLARLLADVDARLEAGHGLPAMVVCRVGVAVDAAAAELQRLAEALTVSRPKGAS